MKQFNLAESLAHPERKVITRDGRKVTRFLCTDAKTDFPIIALIEANPGSTNESLCAFKKDGRYFEDVNSNCDLFFAPEKHEGWVNIFRGLTYNELFCGKIYASKEKAESYANDTTLATIKIEWEE